MLLKIIKITAIAAILAILTSCGTVDKTSSAAVSKLNSTASAAKSETYVRGPQSVGSMTLSGLFYKPKQSSVVRLVDVRGASAEIITALRALQGLVAREKNAAIYLFEDDSDTQWQTYLEAEYGVYFDDCTPAQLFSEFSKLISSFYLYSVEHMEYFNQILTIAACENAVPVTEEALENLMSASLAGIEKTDFREKWTNAEEALTQANEYISETNPNYIYTAGASEFLDYAYAVKAYCISEPALSAGSGSLCTSREDAGRPALIFSSGDYSSAISALSAFGYARVNCSNTKNTTFFSSLPQSGKKYSQPYSVDRKARNNKVYYSLVFFDGPNSGISSPQLENIWEKANNDNLPFGIQINTLMADLIPAALARYHHHRSSTGELTAKAGSFAEIDEKKAAPAILRELYGFQEAYLKKSGITVESVNNGLLRFAERVSVSENKEEESSSATNSTEAAGPDYVLNPLPDYITTLNITSPEELSVFFENINNGSTALFYSIFIDINRFGEADVWDTVRLGAELAGTKYPGKYEALLPGDLILTSKKYQETLAASSSGKPSESANSSSKKK